ncbi:MAG: TAXI family TRAP transporter solute-binding subunit [Hyphomicrobiaceae bacterium]
MRFNVNRVQIREIAIVGLPAVLLVIAAFWLTAQFVQPAPPATFRITTGSETGAYFALAKRYAEIIDREGISVEVVASKGSVENLARLKDADAGYAAAFLQGGIVEPADGETIVSVGRMFYEPLWIFYKMPDDLVGIPELSGLRVAIGPEGSGTRALAEKLLAANGLDKDHVVFLAETGRSAMEALLEGRADAAVYVSSASSPLIQEMLNNANLKLLDNPQAEAYTRKFPYLHRLQLPRGSIDLVRDEPPADLSLLAPTAALVVRRDTHPAIVDLLAQAALEVHGGAGLLERAGEFPMPSDPELPFSEDARRIYTSGVSFLQLYLPFWLANFLERSFIMLLPILAVVLPLIQVVPWLYEMRVRARILYWYGRLTRVEKELDIRKGGDALMRFKSDVEQIDDAVSKLPVPLPYIEQVFDLRANIDMVRQRIAARLAGLPEQTVAVE